MELKLNYYDEFQQLSSKQIFTDRNPQNWNLPLIKNAKICGDTTVYLHDISAWNIPGETLIIDTERPPHTTDQSTRKLIRDFLRSQPCRDVFIRMMTDHLNITQARPIVFGTFRVVPLNGTTRGSADWVFAHRLRDLYADPEDSRFSFLNFDDGKKSLQVHVPFTESMICSKLTKAQHISELTYDLMQGFADIFGMTVLKPKNEVSCQIDRRIQTKEHPELLPIDETLIDLAAHLFTIASEILLDGPVISTKAAKKLLMDPAYDLWRL